MSAPMPAKNWLTVYHQKFACENCTWHFRVPATPVPQLNQMDNRVKTNLSGFSGSEQLAISAFPSMGIAAGIGKLFTRLIFVCIAIIANNRAL
jgi:hypothetical protein